MPSISSEMFYEKSHHKLLHIIWKYIHTCPNLVFPCKSPNTPSSSLQAYTVEQNLSPNCFKGGDSTLALWWATPVICRGFDVIKVCRRERSLRGCSSVCCRPSKKHAPLLLKVLRPHPRNQFKYVPGGWAEYTPSSTKSRLVAEIGHWRFSLCNLRRSLYRKWAIKLATAKRSTHCCCKNMINHALYF